jgi:hypothetical protein
MKSKISCVALGLFVVSLFGCGPRAHHDPLPDGSPAVDAGDAMGPDTAQEGTLSVPRVIAVDPADGATNGEPRGPISITFSEAMDPTSITMARVTLNDGSSDVSTLISYAGVTAEVTPTKRLGLLGTYQLTVKGSVTSAKGQPMGADFTSTFIVRDGVWTAEAVAPFTGDSVPVLATDGDGKSLAVWVQAIPSGSTSYHIIASWHTVEGIWSSPTQLDGAGSSVGTSIPLVSSNDAGDAVVVWLDGSGLKARQYRRGAWEATAEPIDGTGSLTYPRGLSMTNSGQALVVGTGGSSVFGDHLSTLGQWDAAPLALGTWSGMSVAFALTANRDGDSFVAWVSSVFATVNAPITVSRFVSSTSRWSIASSVTGAETVAGYPSVAADATGEAMIVWPANGTDLKAAAFTKTNGWAGALPVSQPLNSDRQINRTQLVFDGLNYLLVWAQTLNGVNNLYANQFTAQGWGVPVLVSDGDHSLPFALILETDRRGNAIVLWEQYGVSGNDVLTARYRGADATWLPGRKLNVQEAPSSSGSTSMVVAANGVAAAIWIVMDANGKISAVKDSFFQ